MSSSPDQASADEVSKPTESTDRSDPSQDAWDASLDSNQVAEWGNQTGPGGQKPSSTEHRREKEEEEDLIQQNLEEFEQN